MVKNTSYCCREPRFSSHQPHGSSQLSITVSGASHPLELELQVYISHVIWMLESEFQPPDKVERYVSSPMVLYFCVLIDWICVCVCYIYTHNMCIHTYILYIYSLENIYLNSLHIFLNHIFCFYCLAGLFSKSLQTLPSITEHLLCSKNEIHLGDSSGGIMTKILTHEAFTFAERSS